MFTWALLPAISPFTKQVVGPFICGLLRYPLDPLQSALLPDPDVSNDEDGKENTHLQQPEKAESLELNRPRKQEDSLHIKYHEQDGHNIKADGVSAAGIVFRCDAALVRHQLRWLRVFRPHKFGDYQCDRGNGEGHRHKNKDGDVISGHERLSSRKPNRRL